MSYIYDISHLRVKIDFKGATWKNLGAEERILLKSTLKDYV
jgi:hypothetical protein